MLDFVNFLVSCSLGEFSHWSSWKCSKQPSNRSGNYDNKVIQEYIFSCNIRSDDFIIIFCHVLYIGHDKI